MAQHSAFVNWTQYLALRGLAGFIQCFEVEQNHATASTIGRLYHTFNRRRTERAEQNIALSFPDWPAEKVRETARKSIQHMFQLFMVESIMTPRLITPNTWQQYIRFRNVHELLTMLLRREPAIFVTGHFGNWEALGTALAAIGYPVVALARPLDNPLINDWLLQIREARGMQIVTKWGATPILQDTLRRGGHVAFIADQNAGEDGMFVPFFGRLASSYKSIGLLAMRYNVPIVAGHAIRLGHQFAYELECTDIIRPADWESQPDPLFYVTARFNRAMEMSVRRAPEQYLWLHRRWKSRPKHEREMQPFPAKLRQKLEELPWMTQDELDRVTTWRA